MIAMYLGPSQVVLAMLKRPHCVTLVIGDRSDWRPFAYEMDVTFPRVIRISEASRRMFLHPYGELRFISRDEVEEKLRGLKISAAFRYRNTLIGYGLGEMIRERLEQ